MPCRGLFVELGIDCKFLESVAAAPILLRIDLVSAQTKSGRIEGAVASS